MNRITTISIIALAFQFSFSADEFDPDDTWYRAFLHTQKAAQLEKNGDLAAALNANQTAFAQFKKLALGQPDFHPNLVHARLQLVAENREHLLGLIRKRSQPQPQVPEEKIPDSWIPREYNGQMTYLIPLIETRETKAFSKIEPVPAAKLSLQTLGRNIKQSR